MSSTRIAGFSCLLLLCGLLLISIFEVNWDKHEASKLPLIHGVTIPPAPSTEQKPDPPAIQPPKLTDSGKKMFAYELYQFPFTERGNIVTIDTVPLPLFFEGKVRDYSAYPRDEALASGLIGLQFDRQISENEYLYNVRLSENGEPATVGQMLVVIKESHTNPNQNRLWRVVPLGLVAGTNGFGAQIKIPAVRFVDYVDE